MEKVKFVVGRRYYNSENGKLELCTKITYQSVYFGKKRYNRHGCRNDEDERVEYTNEHFADKYCE